jgi:hypothetical protein
LLQEVLIEMADNFPVAQALNIRDCGFDEKWLQDQIYDNPSILGLGELEVVRREKKQSSGGRLDLLIKNPEDDSMYEVEIMLGATDESHIIRTIEYWDLEKKRWPQRQHYAVLVAETITRRFFNVISLLSLSIPMMAIQVNMIEVNGQKSLHFTKVLDLYEEPEEDDGTEGTYDEAYWQKKSSSTVDNARALKEIVDKILGESALRYLKSYIAINTNNTNQFWLHKRWGDKSLLGFRVKPDITEEVEELLNARDLSYTLRKRIFRLPMDKQKILENAELFEEIARKIVKPYEA